MFCCYVLLGVVGSLESRAFYLMAACANPGIASDIPGTH